MLPLALVIQCFVKADTLRAACESLLRCTGTEVVDLIFWSDSAVASRNEARYSYLTPAVSAYIEKFTRDHSGLFRSVSSYENERNLGTCKTCQVALDFAFSLHPFVIFAEDDVVFARDALEWFDEMRLRGILADEKVWAIAGESVFFDSRAQDLPSGWKETMRDLATKEQLNASYVKNQFIPSTCFATTRERWAEFGTTRGQPLGDVDLCLRCKNEDRHAVFPVVARVKDIGMLHEDGYSVAIHTKAGVSEIKNTYIMSDDVNGPGARDMSLLVDGLGRIFSLSTLLRGK